MALHKVCGIETEYGIITRGFDANPVVASSVLVNAYAGNFPQLTGWDFADETPGSDARGFVLEDAFPPEVETHLVNSVLTNGARYYVDHAHPEVSTPECTSASQVVLYDRAAEEIIRQSAASARESFPRVMKSFSTRTTPTAKAIPTVVTRITWSIGICRSDVSPGSSRLTSSHVRSSRVPARSDVKCRDEVQVRCRTS